MNLFGRLLSYIRGDDENERLREQSRRFMAQMADIERVGITPPVIPSDQEEVPAITWRKIGDPWKD